MLLSLPAFRNLNNLRFQNRISPGSPSDLQLSASAAFKSGSAITRSKEKPSFTRRNASMRPAANASLDHSSCASAAFVRTVSKGDCVGFALDFLGLFLFLSSDFGALIVGSTEPSS